MSTIPAKTHFTPEDLLKMPDGDLYELVDGQLVERDMGTRSSWIGGRIMRLVTIHYGSDPPAWVFPADASYQCFSDAPERVRKPDFSAIAFGRLAALPEGHIPIVPDLAVEVISPNDLAYEVEEKIQEFLSAGVKLVWTVHPVGRYVRVDRADGTTTTYYENEELTGENVLPGFRCPVREIFRLPQPAPKT